MSATTAACSPRDRSAKRSAPLCQQEAGTKAAMGVTCAGQRISRVSDQVAVLLYFAYKNKETEKKTPDAPDALQERRTQQKKVCSFCPHLLNFTASSSFSTSSRHTAAIDALFIPASLMRASVSMRDESLTESLDTTITDDKKLDQDVDQAVGRRHKGHLLPTVVSMI